MFLPELTPNSLRAPRVIFYVEGQKLYCSLKNLKTPRTCSSGPQTKAGKQVANLQVKARGPSSLDKIEKEDHNHGKLMDLLCMTEEKLHKRSTLTLKIN